LLLNGHFLRRARRANLPLETYLIIYYITIVSSDCPDRAAVSAFAGMRLARKSQGFGKICVESFPKYIKLSRAGDGFYQPVWRKWPNINKLIYDKNIKIEQIRVSVWQ
jgi:hypothetical protein